MIFPCLILLSLMTMMLLLMMSSCNFCINGDIRISNQNALKENDIEQHFCKSPQRSAK